MKIIFLACFLLVSASITAQKNFPCEQIFPCELISKKLAIVYQTDSIIVFQRKDFFDFEILTTGENINEDKLSSFFTVDKYNENLCKETRYLVRKRKNRFDIKDLVDNLEMLHND